jgi:hypothetical protein
MNFIKGTKMGKVLAFYLGECHGARQGISITLRRFEDTEIWNVPTCSSLAFAIRDTASPLAAPNQL